MQALFNQQVFVAALEDFVHEGISVGGISFPDNGDAMRLLEERPLGILSLLQEECSLGSGSDATLLNKLKSHHTNSTVFKISRRHADCFTLRHYAADVRYAIDGFLSKNKDPLHEDLLLTMEESGAPLIRTLFARTPSVDSASDGHRGHRCGSLAQACIARGAS